MNVRKTILFKFTNSDLLLALVESLNLKYSGFEPPYYKVRKGHLDFYLAKIGTKQSRVGVMNVYFNTETNLIIYETFATPNQYTISIVLVVF